MLVAHTKRLIMLRVEQVEAARGILRALPGRSALTSAPPMPPRAERSSKSPKHRKR
jgi:hypothetical protein